MRPVLLRPEAMTDLEDAWRWYEERRTGLGDEFEASVDAALSAISASPHSAARVHGAVRRKVLRRFPYALFYLDETDRIEVLAIFHTSRDPRGWRGRL